MSHSLVTGSAIVVSGISSTTSDARIRSQQMVGVNATDSNVIASPYKDQEKASGSVVCAQATTMIGPAKIAKKSGCGGTTAGAEGAVGPRKLSVRMWSRNPTCHKRHRSILPMPPTPVHVDLGVQLWWGIGILVIWGDLG